MTVSNTTPALAAVKAMLFDALKNAEQSPDVFQLQDHGDIIWICRPARMGPMDEETRFDADKLAATVLAWSDARHAAEIAELKAELAVYDRKYASRVDQILEANRRIAELETRLADYMLEGVGVKQ